MRPVRFLLACALALLGVLGVLPATAAHRPLPPVRHVFVIVLENKGFGAAFGPSAPRYLARTLPAHGALLTQYYGIGHESLDNYVAMVSGQGPNPQTQADCQFYDQFEPGVVGPDGQARGSGCVYPSNVRTVANQLMAAHDTWRGYMQDMGNDPSRESATCGHPALDSQDRTQTATAKDQYASRHDPFVYFEAVVATPACREDVVPLSRLRRDLGTVATTPNFSFITPNLCNDGHDAPCAGGAPGGLVQANRFLQAWVPLITGSAAFRHDGMLVILFDESDGPQSVACCGEQATDTPLAGVAGPGGGRVGAVVLSPFVRSGTRSAVGYNHYGLLRTVEDLFGLPHLGYAGAAGVRPFGRDVFTAW